MALSKKQRQAVWAKSGGYCWYCGCNLPERGWHADHVESVLRQSKMIRGPGNSYEMVKGEMLHSHLDHIDNIVPTCAPCNLFKTSYGLEGFRKEVAAQIERARKSSVNFRTAERFGLLTVVDQPVVFWFEQRAAIAENPMLMLKERAK